MMNVSPLRVAAGLLLLLAVSCAPSPRPELPEPDIREANLRQTVNHLCAIAPARHSGNPHSMRKAADFIGRSFRKHGLRTVYQDFIVDGVRHANVIASAGPAGGHRVIVGAHYDVCGDQPGADDNASAVAGLIECARFAKLHEKHLRYGVDFVAYALEEPPHFGTTEMGSYVHARSLHDQGVPVRAMICMDMIGYFTDEPRSQRYPLPGLGLLYPSRGNFIAVVGNFGSARLSREVRNGMRATKVPVRRILAPSALPGIDFSDHRNYWHFGYPAVMITDTAFYRSPHYHQPGDLPETLSFGPMAEVVKGLCNTLLAIE
jgi:hypothetical protein